MTSYEVILNRANQLSEPEKIKLLNDMFESINSTDLKDREALWANEAEHRLNEYDQGNMKSDDWEDIKKDFM